MKIVTINLEEKYVKLLNELSDEDDGFLFSPSRSEICRIAIRDYLKKNLPIAMRILKLVKDEEINDLENFVKIPIGNKEGNRISKDKSSKNKYKKYKVIKKLT
jgi:metal-responsive CopG/Arc/MetJ family transcriptional regulator